MTITPLGIPFAALFLVCLLNGRSSFVWAVALSLFFNDSAMLVVGSVGLTPYTVALLVVVALQVVHVVRARLRDGSGRRRIDAFEADGRAGRWLRRALVVTVVYGTLISAIGPWLFAGLPVMPSQGSSDYLVDRLPGLGYSLSNLAQIGYLLLNAALVWFIATLPRPPRAPFSAAVGLGVALVLLALVLRLVEAPWPTAFFDNSPRNYYAVAADDPRLRAHFSEPSHLAWFLALALTYATCTIGRWSRWRTALAVATLFVCAIGVVEDPSTTVILALAVLVPAAVAVAVVRNRRLLARPRVVVTAAASVLGASVLAMILQGPLIGWLGPALLGKIGGSSQYSRGKQDLHSLELLLRTFGVGVGLGSNRSSSLLTMLLSDIGLVGTVAYATAVVCAVVVLMTRGSRREAWTLIALSAACAISVADFVLPATWFLIGMAAQASRPARRFGPQHRLVRPIRVPLMAGAG